MRKRNSLHRIVVLAVTVSLSVLLMAGCKKSSSPVATVKTETGEMVHVPASYFMMGSDNGQEDEKSVHKVWLGSFLIDKYEVTQEQFSKLMKKNKSHFKRPANPVETITWGDAALYANARSRAEGLEPCYDETTGACNFSANGYRLPTEAEWEYACRAGTTSNFHFGDSDTKLERYAWFSNNSAEKSHPVGQKKPNAWGIFDMCGNVMEWCNDVYGKEYYAQSPQKNPKGPAENIWSQFVLRGGSWKSSADTCRCAYRDSEFPGQIDGCLLRDDVGFRCVRRTSHIGPSEKSSSKESQVPRKSKTGFLYDDIYLKHDTGQGHPEAPQRLAVIIEQLQKKDLISQLFKLRSSPASLEWITTVHTREYVERVRKSCQTNIEYLDSIDVPISHQSYDVAVSAVGGVLSAVDAVIDGKIKNAFCAVRPPGHHALKDKAMGFCIFNNVAIAACYIQRKHGLDRILIVDWDVHHGNGTQSMFYADPNVLYFSVHQYPFYPLTGEESEKGTGKGLNYNINVPLPAGSGDSEYERSFEVILEPAAIAFDPDFVLISAGFDSQEGDLLGSMKVTPEGFANLTRIVKHISDQCCQGRLVSVLEGGYNLQLLAGAVEAHIKALLE